MFFWMENFLIKLAYLKEMIRFQFEYFQNPWEDSKNKNINLCY